MIDNDAVDPQAGHLLIAYTPLTQDKIEAALKRINAQAAESTFAWCSGCRTSHCGPRCETATVMLNAQNGKAEV